MRGACGTTSWNKDTNESVNERCGMSGKARGVSCGVGEWKKMQVDVWRGKMKVTSDVKMNKSNIEKLNQSEKIFNWKKF